MCSRAVTGDWSDDSNLLTGTPRKVSDPPGIDSLTPSDGALTVAWSAPTETYGLSVTGYDLRYIRSDTPNKTLSNWTIREDVWSSGALRYTLDDLTNGVKYDVGVRALTIAGDGKWSATVSGTPLTVPGPEPQQQNSPATGAPTISGTAQVGETLTADTKGIADDDGLDNVSFGYQWQADDTNIADATGSTYTLADADEGRTIKVKVTFDDDAGNEEALTSAATAAVAAAPAATPLTASHEDAPASHDGQDSFTFKLRFSEEVALSYLTLQDHAFTVTGGTVNKAKRLTQGSNIGWRVTATPGSDADVTLVLPVTTDCNAAGAVCTDDGKKLAAALTLTVPGPEPPQQQNSPATGAPTIGGTARVDETLAASTSSIADADGLVNVSFSYQWVADDADIAGATGTTYTLTDAGPRQGHQSTGELRRRRRQRGGPDQRGYGGGGGGGAAADGQVRGQAVQPRRPDGLHLRAALQRGVRHQLRYPPGPCLQRDGRHGKQGQAADPGEQPRLAHHRNPSLGRRGDRGPAGDHRLQCQRGGLHGGRQDAVQPAGADCQRAGELGAPLTEGFRATKKARIPRIHGKPGEAIAATAMASPSCYRPSGPRRPAPSPAPATPSAHSNREAVVAVVQDQHDLRPDVSYPVKEQAVGVAPGSVLRW